MGAPAMYTKVLKVRGPRETKTPINSFVSLTATHEGNGDCGVWGNRALVIFRPIRMGGPRD